MREPREISLPYGTLAEIGRMLCEEDTGVTFAWFDVEARDVILTTSLYGMDPEAPLAEESEPPPGDPALPPWMEDERRQVSVIRSDATGRYRRVPIGAEFGAPGVLRAFLETLDAGPLYDAVSKAMQGRGAFGRVKDLLRRRGELDRWYQFEEEREVALAVAWLEEQGLRVEEDDEDEEGEEDEEDEEAGVEE